MPRFTENTPPAMHFPIRSDLHSGQLVFLIFIFIYEDIKKDEVFSGCWFLLQLLNEVPFETLIST